MIEVRKVGREYEASIGDITVRKRTAGAARDAVIEVASRILSGSYEPTVVVHRHLVGLLVRVPLGWLETVIDTSSPHQQPCWTFVASENGDRSRHERDLRTWMAQIAGPQSIEDLAMDSQHAAELRSYFALVSTR